MRKRGMGIEETKRYLTVYEYREEKINGKQRTWKSVYELIKPGETFSGDVRNALQKDFKKAKKLIENSIHCIEPRDFPLRG